MKYPFLPATAMPGKAISLPSLIIAPTASKPELTAAAYGLVPQGAGDALLLSRSMQTFSGETITADTLLDDSAAGTRMRFDAMTMQTQTELGLTIEEAEAYVLDKIGNPAFTLSIAKNADETPLHDQSHFE